MGFDLLQDRGELFEMRMAMMQVVDNSHVWQLKLIQDRELVFRFAEPTSVIVKPDLTAKTSSFIGQRTNRRSRDAHFVGLRSVGGRRVGDQYPKLQFQTVPAHDVEDFAVGLVQIGRGDPPGGDAHPVALHRLDFFVKLRNVLGTPVVGQLPNAKLLEHAGSLFGPAVHRVEGHNAPGRKIVAVKHVALSPRRSATAIPQPATQPTRKTTAWLSSWPLHQVSQPQLTVGTEPQVDPDSPGLRNRDALPGDY